MEKGPDRCDRAALPDLKLLGCDDVLVARKKHRIPLGVFPQRRTRRSGKTPPKWRLSVIQRFKAINRKRSATSADIERLVRVQSEAGW